MSFQIGYPGTLHSSPGRQDKALQPSPGSGLGWPVQSSTRTSHSPPLSGLDPLRCVGVALCDLPPHLDSCLGPTHSSLISKGQSLTVVGELLENGREFPELPGNQSFRATRGSLSPGRGTNTLAPHSGSLLFPSGLVSRLHWEVCSASLSPATLQLLTRDPSGPGS